MQRALPAAACLLPRPLRLHPGSFPSSLPPLGPRSMQEATSFKQVRGADGTLVWEPCSQGDPGSVETTLDKLAAEGKAELVSGMWGSGWEGGWVGWGWQSAERHCLLLGLMPLSMEQGRCLWGADPSPLICTHWLLAPPLPFPQVRPPNIRLAYFEKVLLRSRPTVSKDDLEEHEKFTAEFGEEG
jgi:hypothetical protein